jgi:hypothetical protein
MLSIHGNGGVLGQERVKSAVEICGCGGREDGGEMTLGPGRDRWKDNCHDSIGVVVCCEVGLVWRR